MRTLRTTKYLPGAAALLFALAVPTLPALGQTAQITQLAPLYFSMQQGGSNPLPQVVSLVSTGAYINYFSPTAQTSSGGNWLAVNSGCGGGDTPSSCVVSVSATTLAAGTYTGQIAFKINFISGSSSSGGAQMTLSVTLAVHSGGGASLGGLPGALNFAAGNGFLAPAQNIQVVNSGSGSLNWTATASTAGGGNWLSVSAANGTAPSQVAVSVSTQGLSSGTYSGQIAFSASTGAVTVPVTLTIADSSSATFAQIPQLNFTMVQGGNNPLPQILPLIANGPYINYYSPSAQTSSGGNWLNLSNGCGGGDTPGSCVVAVSAATLPAGIYQGQVLFEINFISGISNIGNPVVAAPVTLTVVDGSQPFFGGTVGALNFVSGNGFQPAAQNLQLNNSGPATLQWTASSSLSRNTPGASASWLALSASGGSAPSSLSVSVSAAGLSPGWYSGEVLLQSRTGNVTVPVVLIVLDSTTSTFQQIPAIAFTMAAGASSPLSQTIPVQATGAYINYYSPTAQTSAGGNWLRIANNCSGYSTPGACQVDISGPSLSPGVYAGQILFEINFISGQSSGGNPVVAVPVTLTVTDGTQPFFGGVTGGLSFVSGSGFIPAPQNLQISNAGSGALSWTASVTTFRSNTAAVNWLNISAGIGVAPSTPSVSVSTQGLSPGIYFGQILLQCSSGAVSVPVTLFVLDSSSSAFQEPPPVSFTMPEGGPSPLPQTITISATGAAINYFSPAVETSSGGNWLQVSGCTGGTTPGICSVYVNGSTLSPGIYSGQIILTVNYIADSTNGGNPITIIPVTLTVVSPSGSFLAGTIRELDFVSSAGSTPASQTIQIVNGGPGSLSWSAASSIFRTNAAGTANWLSLSAASGVAPSALSVSVSPSGLGPGTYLAEVLIDTENGASSVPIRLIVLDSSTVAFQQVPAINFTMPVAGPIPASQTFVVQSTGGSLTYYSAFYDTALGGSWLKVSGNSSGTTPQSFTASVTTSSLATGIYPGELVLSTGATSVTVPITLTVGNPAAASGPAITPGGVVPVYSTGSNVQPGEWVSIYGSNLATQTVSWNGDFPTSLGGTSVTIDGAPAYLWFVSPGQINLQVPNDSKTGAVPVVVTTPNGTATSTVTLGQFGPSFSLLDAKHVAGIIYRSNGSGAYGNGAYDIIGPTGNSLGYPTVAARAGDVVSLFGVGYGPTNPAVTAGQPYSGAAPATSTVTIRINNVSVTPTFTGLVEAGLYQLNLTIPSGAGAGDVSLQAAVGGFQTPAGVVISLQ